MCGVTERKKGMSQDRSGQLVQKVSKVEQEEDWEISYSIWQEMPLRILIRAISQSHEDK